MKLFLVDLRNLAYRSFYAFNKESLATSTGKPTAVCYGVASALSRLIADYNPEFLAFAEDHRGRTFRHDLYEGYKANRAETNQEFSYQIPDLMRMIAAYGIKTISAEGFEADDVIGTLAKKFASENLHVYIVSNDKDYMQLIGPNVSLCRPKNGGGYQIGNVELVAEKFDCTPGQVVDCLALMGDSSDNVPGVKGIGEKTAAALIKSCGTVEGVYASLGSLKKGIAAKLAPAASMAMLSKSLVKIKTDIPIDITIQELRFDSNTALKRPELLSFFKEMEFNSMMPQAPQQSILDEDNVI